MSDRRVEVRIVFADKRERDYMLPLNLMDRRIDHFDVDGVRYIPARRHSESWEWLNE